MSKARREGRKRAEEARDAVILPAIEKYNAFIGPVIVEYQVFEASIKPDYDASREERQAYLEARREPRAKYRSIRRRAYFDLLKVMNQAESVFGETAYRLQAEEAEGL